MKAVGTVAATAVWVCCWLIAPASRWLNERILDEQWFETAMIKVLQIEDVDREITDRATAQVMQDARTFVAENVPFLSTPADALLERAEPTVSGVVNSAVNSQPGQKMMLGVATQAHNAFLAWLDGDSLGQPGLSADLDTGEARIDLDEMLVGEVVQVGPLDIPLDALDLPGLNVPVPLPPDWMRAPLNFVRAAFLPALVGIAVSAVALVLLDRPRLRLLAVASGLTALVCGVTAALIQSTWTLSGADSADWTITRAIGELMVRPWITAYVWVIVAMIVIAVGAVVWDRYRMVASRPAAYAGEHGDALS
ncbi:MAG: hypothetical protein H6528_00165 [Actinobacteria bacterium]|nr:hypothetical protein [Actinomycetota bacterium]MCB8995698.1 hypothetical protein [Actinomycetota bacterium]